MQAFLAVVILLTLAFDAHAASRIFYDGSEAGNTDLWPLRDPVTGGNRDKCTSVTVAEDGGSGPYAGSRMIRCRYSGFGDSPSAYETLRLNTSNYTSELFIRTRFRRSATWDLRGTLNVNDISQKILRFFQTGPYHDLFEVTGHSDAGAPSSNNANAGNQNDSEFMPTYWAGDHPSDLTNQSTGWHEIEYYINQSTGTVKVWHDGALIRNNTGMNFAGSKWVDFYITSNGETPVFAEYTYYDEFEVYSDVGSASITGTMANGDIALSGGGDTTPPAAPSNVFISKR